MTAMRLISCALFSLAATAGAHAATVSVMVTDKEGKPVPDAVVIVTPATPGGAPKPLPMQATIAQEKMQFVPAVTVVPVGARVTFVNNDSWEHHVRGSAAGLAQFSAASSGGFELRLDGKPAGQPGKSAEVVLAKAGPVLLGCHIHGSMKGHVYVSDSPWAQKTTAEGQAVFDDVPPGTAQVRVWHAEQLIDLPASTVAAGAATARVAVQLPFVPRKRRS
jgi:plastocyanin